jgi:hypothetical protein
MYEYAPTNMDDTNKISIVLKIVSPSILTKSDIYFWNMRSEEEKRSIKMSRKGIEIRTPFVICNAMFFSPFFGENRVVILLKRGETNFIGVNGIRI